MEESTKDRLIQLIVDSGQEGITGKEVTEELGISKSMVSKLKKQLESEGVICYSSGKKPMLISDKWRAS